MVSTRALVITSHGGPEVLKIQEREVRMPGPREVLVAVAAAGLNRADTLQRRGFYPAPQGCPDDVPGLEVAGTVAQVGPGVSLFVEGDAVMAITGGGGMCTHVVLHERELMRVPKGLSLIDAAAIPEVFLTAYDALYLQAEVRLGEVALVHAVASGVGTAALQLNRVAGVTTVGTSRSPDKLRRCQELGLEHAVLTQKGFEPADVLGRFSDGVDVILDTVGAKYVASNLEVLAPLGRVVTIGLVGGVKAELDLGRLLRKRARWFGSVLRARSLEEKATLARRFEDEIVPLFEDGRLRPVVDEVLPMQAAGEAHRRMEANETFGKLVLRW